MTRKLDPEWEYVPDAVMGGKSRGKISQERVQGHPATRLRGDVSLENNGGFIQMAFDFLRGGEAFDASGYQGIELGLIGNDEDYELRLRTTDLDRPWQSFRSCFAAPRTWTTRRFAFADLEPYRTDATFDAARLRRCGLVAVGRAFQVDLAVSDIALYR